MNDQDKEKKISETLNVIKRALENKSSDDSNENILILNKLVQEDGTILKIENEDNIIENDNINKNLDIEIKKIFDKNLDSWLNQNMPALIKKYLKKDN